MTTVSLTPKSLPNVFKTLNQGWNVFGTDIGIWYEQSIDSFEINTGKGGWYLIEVRFNNGHVWGPFQGYLPPRAMIPIRPDSPPPTLGLIRPHGSASDFSGGGGFGIDACGTPGTLLEHDSVMHRHPVGFYDMATGLLRPAASIPVEGYYAGTRGYPYNKVTQPPDYTVKYNPADIYDDRRLAADATVIPSNGIALREQVLSYLAYDMQHLIRAMSRAILLLRDPLVARNMRAMARDCELAWSPARASKILSSTPGIGHSDCGREFAWVGYCSSFEEKLVGPGSLWTRVRTLVAKLIPAAAAVAPDTLANRIRKITRHVAHRKTGILQRFVEGMSGSPYPYGPAPASGVPVGQGIALTQHLEACAQITMMESLGLIREASKLCETILARPGLKWFNTDTGAPEGSGIHGPAEDQACPALAVWVRINRRRALEAVKLHKIPASLSVWVGPFSDLTKARDACLTSTDQGKTRWLAAELSK